MTTDADPKAKEPAARLEQLEDRASRLTGAVWFMLDAQLAMVERLGALSGDPQAFRRGMADALGQVGRVKEPQLSPRARQTYGELLDRLREGPPPATPYIAPETSAAVERTKLHQG